MSERRSASPRRRLISASIFAHFLVGDDEEIAGAAGGIEDANAGNALAQVQKLAGIVSRLFQAWPRRSSRKRGLSTLRMFGTLV